MSRISVNMSDGRAAVDTAHDRFRALYTAFTLRTREVCHVEPDTDRLSVCAALTALGST